MFSSPSFQPGLAPSLPPLSPLSYQTANSAMHALAPRSHSSAHIFMPTPLVTSHGRTVLSHLRARSTCSLIQPELWHNETHSRSCNAGPPSLLCRAPSAMAWPNKEESALAGPLHAGGLEGEWRGIASFLLFLLFLLMPGRFPVAPCA